MSKRRQQVLNSSSEDEDESDIEPNKRAKPDSSDSSSEGSDLDWTVEGGAGAKQRKKLTPNNGVDKAEKNSSNSGEESWESGEEKSDNAIGGDSDSESGQRSESGSLSQDESTTGADEFSDGLDSELKGGPEDRAKLAQMTEAEREQEIYRRLELRERLQAQKEIYKQMKKERRKKEKRERPDKPREKSEKKRVVNEREFSAEFSRRSERKRKQTDIKRSEAIDQLKHNRLMQRDKHENEATNDESQNPTKQTSPKKKPQYTVEGVFGESGSEEGSSEDEPGNKMVQEDIGDGSDEELEFGLKKDQRNLPISCLEDINKIRMSRFRLDQWIHMPYFNDVVLGSFVRIGIGSNEGRSIYRVAEVIEVVESQKVYMIINSPTNKALRLRHGSQERIFRMQFVSNSDITKAEFDKWKTAVNYAGMRLPTNLDIRKRIKMIEEAKAIVLNNDDIKSILKEKEKYRKAPSNYAMAKARLVAEKEKAEFDGNQEEVQILHEKLQEINQRAEVLEKNRNKELTRISFINERNRMHNLEREETIRREMAAGKEDDPFTRRKCAPKLAPIALLHNSLVDGMTPQKTDAESTPQRLPIQTPVSTSQPSSQSTEPVVGLLNSFQLTKTPETNGNESIYKTPRSGKNLAESSLDLSSAHDFDIPIDIPTSLGDVLPPMALLSTPEANQGNPPRKNLNLSDYKKRKGQI